MDMLCNIVVSHYPCPQWLRETSNVFQSLKLHQTVSHICRNVSNMFVAELEVIARVDLVWLTLLEGLILHSYSLEVTH